MNKIVSLNEYKQSSSASVLVGGCFDMLHIGHIRFLKNAKEKAERLIIVLESDEFIRSSKKREPFHTQEERAEVLSAIIYVDTIILLPYMTTFEEYGNMVEIIKPSLIAVSKNDQNLEYKREHARKIGAHVVEVIGHIPHKSSTLVREYISSKKHKDVQ